MNRPQILLFSALTACAAEAATPATAPVQAQMPTDVSTGIKMRIALSLDTPTCADHAVGGLPAGTYYGKDYVIAYPSAEEASSSATWSDELRIMASLLKLVDTADGYQAPCLNDAVYKSIDKRSTDRFIEPGATFVLSDEHSLSARRARVDGHNVWLAKGLPASCFSSTMPGPFEEGDFVKTCFVPLVFTDTAGSN